MGKPLILGVGNTMYGDDGVGYCVARAMRACFPPTLEVDVEPRQTVSLGDSALLLDRRVAVIIDAGVDIDYIGVYEVGDSDELPIRLEDSHSVDPIKLVEVASAAGFRGKVFLVLIPVRDTEFGKGLSRYALKNAVKAAVIVCNLLEINVCPIECIEERMRDCLGEPLID